MPKPPLGPQRRTNPLIWGAAAICAIIAIAVITIGIFVVISYVVIHPKTPSISVPYSNLDRFDYNQMGSLAVQVTIVIRAKNDNVKVRANFYGLGLVLGFEGQEIARLVNEPFDVEKNASVEFHYVVASEQIPLRGIQQRYVQLALEKRVISLELKGKAKTKWKVWGVGSVKFSLHLDCHLQFFVPSGTSSNGSRCSSKHS